MRELLLTVTAIAAFISFGVNFNQADRIERLETTVKILDGEHDQISGVVVNDEAEARMGERYDDLEFVVMALERRIKNLEN